MKPARMVVLVLLVLVTLAPAQRRRRDPLTAGETEQLREVSPEPEKKLKLYVTFARARVEAIDQLRSDPRFAENRGQRIHDLLEDFTNIEDELDGNIGEFASRNEDMRKPLKLVIEADSGFQLKLRTLKETAASDPQAAKEARDYTFALANAIDAVDSNLDGARELLSKQEVAFKQQKKKK